MSDPNLQILLTAKNMSGKAWASIQKDIKVTTKMTNTLTKSMRMLGGVIGGYGVIQLGKSFLDAGVQMDRMRRSMEGVTGSATKAASNIKFLRDESNRLGTVFQDQLKGFNLISAATRDTVLEGQKAREMYTDLMESITAFQLSQDDAHNSVRAIQQMLAKGTIQAEEFRGQFGERIPIAFKAMQIATGATAKELQEMMKAGELLSVDVVPRLLKVMSLLVEQGVATAVKGAQAEINRLTNTWFELRATIMDAGFTEVIARQLNELTTNVDKWVKNNQEGIKEFVEGTIELGRKIVETASLVDLALFDMFGQLTIFITNSGKVILATVEHVRENLQEVPRFYAGFVEGVAKAIDAIPGDQSMITDSMHDFADAMGDAEVSGKSLAKTYDGIRKNIQNEIAGHRNAIILWKERIDLAAKEKKVRSEGRGGEGTRTRAETEAKLLEIKRISAILKELNKDERDHAEDVKKAIKEMQDAEKKRLQIKKESLKVGREEAELFFSQTGIGEVGGIAGIITTELQNVAVEQFADRVGDSLKMSVSSALTSVFGAGFASTFGGAVTNIGAGLAGAGISAFISGLTGGGDFDAKRRAERERDKRIIESLEENTRAIIRNTETMTREYSTFSTQISGSMTDITKSFFDTLVGLQGINRASAFGSFDVGDIKSGRLIKFVREFISRNIELGIDDSAMHAFYLNFEASLNEFVTRINLVQGDIIKNSKDMLEEAGDVFKSEAEIQKRKFNESSKDLLIGLAETFETEGIYTQEGVDILNLFTDAADLANFMLATLVEGTEEYNQVLEVSTNLIETAILQEKARYQALIDGLSGLRDIQDDIQFRLSGLGREDWIKSQLDGYGEILSRVGQLTEDEFREATDLVTEMFTLRMQEEQQIINDWKTVADKVKGLVSTIRDAMLTIRYGPLNVALNKDKLPLAQQDYETLLAEAQTGDEEAIRKFVDFSSQYLQVAQNTFKSSESYRSIYQSVMDDLSEMNEYMQTEDYSQLLYNETVSIVDEQKLANSVLMDIRADLKYYTDALMVAAAAGSAPNPDPPRPPDLKTLDLQEVTNWIKVNQGKDAAREFLGRVPDLGTIDLFEYIKSLGVPGYADGGYVSRPTLAVVGEGAGGEYIIPESQMTQIIDRASGGSQTQNITIMIGSEVLEAVVLRTNGDQVIKAKRRGRAAVGVYR